MDFVTEQMELGLLALQTVQPFDFGGAYLAAYCGISAIDPRRVPAAADLIYGRSLALNVWSKRQTATLNVR
jgi:hypothetical protein